MQRTLQKGMPTLGLELAYLISASSILPSYLPENMDIQEK
jgi:hypothetical protein